MESKGIAMPTNVMVRSLQPGVAVPVFVSTILARKSRFAITNLKGGGKINDISPIPCYIVSLN